MRHVLLVLLFADVMPFCRARRPVDRPVEVVQAVEADAGDASAASAATR